MPFRGGGGSLSELGLGGVGQQAQAQVPGLLQMASGGQPQSFGTWAPLDYSALMQSQGGGSSGGSGGGSGGDDYRGGAPPSHTGRAWGWGGVPISPQDEARYFDAGGYKIDDPRQVAADAGISVGQLASGFLPRYGATGLGYEFPSDKGGFFNIEALSRLGGQSVPGMATHGQNAPSTNNWRLLGMGPGWIMRNGSLINTQASEVTRGGAIGHDMGVGVTAEHGMSAQRGSALGTGGSMGMPNRWGDNYYWPGSTMGGFADRWPVNTNV